MRGQANLLEDVTALADLERLRALFEMLETKETMLRLLDATREGEGVQIFIGADNPLFGMAGCSMVVAPYHQQPRAGRRRDRRHRPDAHQLCPHHPDGGLHREGDRPAVGITASSDE